MKLVDFEYDGIRLSDHNFTLCKFDSTNDNQDLGNNINMNNVKGQNSDDYFSANAYYDDTFSPDIQICKTVCGKNDSFIVSDEELRYIMRWLNRKKYLKFKPIYEDGSFSDVYYMATFNISIVKMAGDIIGFTLKLITNAPYGFGDTVSTNGIIGSTNKQLIVNDISDEIGHIYCDVKIKCTSDGDLKITNLADPNNVMIVKNCKANEIITLHGKTKMIESSLAGHTKLYNDFNYNFIRIINTFDNNLNTFTSTIPCEITISYSPIRKVGLIV